MKVATQIEQETKSSDVVDSGSWQMAGWTKQIRTSLSNYTESNKKPMNLFDEKI